MFFSFFLIFDLGFEMVVFLSLGNLLFCLFLLVYLNDLNFFFSGLFFLVDEGIGVDI